MEQGKDNQGPAAFNDCGSESGKDIRQSGHTAVLAVKAARLYLKYHGFHDWYLMEVRLGKSLKSKGVRQCLGLGLRHFTQGCAYLEFRGLTAFELHGALPDTEQRRVCFDGRKPLSQVLGFRFQKDGNSLACAVLMDGVRMEIRCKTLDIVPEIRDKEQRPNRS